MLPARSELRFIVVGENIALQVSEVDFPWLDAVHPTAGNHFVVDESGPDRGSGWGKISKSGQFCRK